MNRRALLTSFAGVAVAGILTPELAQAVGQWSQAAASGIDWAKLKTSSPPEEPTAEQVRGWLEGLNNEDLGPYKM